MKLFSAPTKAIEEGKFFSINGEVYRTGVRKSVGYCPDELVSKETAWHVQSRTHMCAEKVQSDVSVVCSRRTMFFAQTSK